MIGGQKTFYALATRKSGFSPDLFRQVDDITNMPSNSANLFLFTVAAWMVLFGANFAGWYGEFFSDISGGAVATFDVAGLVPITLNGFLIPVLVMVVIKQVDFGWFNRFVAPIVALVGASFLVYAVWYTQRGAAFFYLALFVVLMGIGMLKYRKKQDEADGDGRIESQQPQEA
jgi:APA family basic amino acid/polyamine antiporter